MTEVSLIDHMGSDLSVVNAARVSFDKTSEWDLRDDWSPDEDPRDIWELNAKDQKLIKYLATHGHWSPFAHAFASFRIKAPLFVARQLGKHQVGLAWNEVSRRYVDDEPEFFEPSEWRARATNVKQGSSTTETVDVFEAFMDNPWKPYTPEGLQRQALLTYNMMLQAGVCPEQARMVLPQSMMTTWIWSGSLMAFRRVCSLRMDPHTQAETREVAYAISDHMEQLFPHSWKALSCTSS